MGRERFAFERHEQEVVGHPERDRVIGSSLHLLFVRDKPLNGIDLRVGVVKKNGKEEIFRCKLCIASAY